jgi:hypothetical protein
MTGGDRGEAESVTVYGTASGVIQFDPPTAEETQSKEND